MKQGLALCGGGSLGAYEMGVWAYLRERDFRFDVITGTSIGAINGAMIAADGYEVAKKMWDHVTVEDIMKNGINFDKDLIGEIDLKKGSKWKTFVNGYIKNKGANTEPLEKMLQEYIPPLRVNHLKKPKLGIIKCTFPGMKEVKVLVNKLKDDEVVEELICSASCWPVFPVRHNKKGSFVDGGWRNNLPIDYCLELGAEQVIAVMLNSLPVAQKQELFDLPNVTLIRPSLPEGSFLSFKQNAIQMNVLLGYMDAKKRFGEYRGIRSFLKEDAFFRKTTRAFYKSFVQKDPVLYAKTVEKKKKDIVIQGVKEDESLLYLLLMEDVMEECEIPFLEERTLKDTLDLIKKALPSLKGKTGLSAFLREAYKGSPKKVNEKHLPYLRFIESL